MNLVKILSIDGGGVRGVIPAMVLSEIERRADAPVSKLFDLIAGTSTGGIIALGLTKPDDRGEPAYEAHDLVELYSGEAAQIFHESTWQHLRSLNGTARPKFTSTGIEEVLEEYFGESRLKDALTDLVVPAYEIEQRTPWFFRSSRARTDPNYDFPMKEVARATSAAPTYFQPARLTTESDVDYWTLVDGGVFANNPTMCAVVDATTRLNADRTQLLVVSLGTGEITKPIPYEKAADWGLVGWARTILDVVFDGVSETVAYQTQQLCPAVNGARRYYRFQATLTSGLEQKMDDASGTHIHGLKLLAADLIDRHGSELDDVCGLLTADA